MSTDRPNIALIVLDTLRADAFDRHFDWLDGTRYGNAWSTSHWTSPAHASMFTGQYGSELGVHGKSKHLDCPSPTLAERLRNDNWTTRGYSNNIHVSQWFDFDRGFQEFYNKQYGTDLGFNWAKFISDHRHEGPVRYLKLLRQIYNSDAPALPALKQGLKLKLDDLRPNDDEGDDSGAKETLAWLRRTAIKDGGEFLFVNLMEAHAPYEAPKSHRTVEPVTVDGARAIITGSPEVDVEHLRAAYNDCVRYLSEVYEEIYTELAANFDVIITVGDHGEGFGEYGGWEHFSGLWPSVTHVPFVVSTPGDVDEPKPTHKPISLLDVYQTICDYAGINHGEQSRGTSLAKAEPERTHLLTETHGVLLLTRKRMINQGVSPKKVDEYDLELHGVAGEDGYTFENFQRELVDHEGGVDDAAEIMEELSSAIETRRVSDEQDIPDHVESQLEYLGYA